MRISAIAFTMAALLGCSMPAPADDTGDPGVDTDTDTNVDTGPTNPVLVTCPQCVPEAGRPGVYRYQVFPPPDDWSIIYGQFAQVGGAWVVDNDNLGAVTTAYSGVFPLQDGWIMLEVEALAAGMSVSVQQAPDGEFTATVFGENTSDAAAVQVIEAGAIIGGTGSDADPYVFTGEHTAEAGIDYYAKVEGAYDATLVGYDLLFRVP